MNAIYIAGIELDGKYFPVGEKGNATGIALDRQLETCVEISDRSYFGV